MSSIDVGGGTSGNAANVGASDPSVLNSLLAWTFDPANSVGSSGGLITSGHIYAMKLAIPKTISVTNMVYRVVTAGAGLTAAQNLLGLYTVSGDTATQLGVTGDQSSNFAGAANRTAALTGGPFNLPGGPAVYAYALILSVSTVTAPLIMRSDAAQAPTINIGSTILRAAQQNTAQTALPATFTVSALTDSGNDYLYFVGLS